MENASKALLMAASVLIGALLVSVMVYIFYFSSDYSSKIKDNIAVREVYETNVKFEIYDGRNDLTVHDVQTIINLVNDYNEKMPNQISINLTTVSLESELESNEETTYKCNIYYNDKTVNRITITKN